MTNFVGQSVIDISDSNRHKHVRNLAILSYTMAAIQKFALSSGWKFKETDQPDSALLPVSQVPTNVQIDLLDNGM
jgi:hypothetical protein